MVADPLFSRINTRDNTPAIVHVELVPGRTIELTIAAKGGGSENKARFTTLNPGADVVKWVVDTMATPWQWLVPAGHDRHRRRRQCGKGNAARQGSAEPADRHDGAVAARPG